MAFPDQLVELCLKEIKAAKRSGGDERVAALVESLATTLGRVIALVSGGDPKAIEALLTACETHCAAEAAEHAPLFAHLKAARVRGSEVH